MAGKEKGIFWKYLFCSVLTTVILLSIAGLLIKFSFKIDFISEASCSTFKHNSLVQQFTFCFYGSDWDESTYLSSITSFYSTLITVLIATQSLVSALAFLVIRASSKRAVEEEVEKELPKYFDTVFANNKIKEFVHIATKSISNEESDDLKNTVSGLQNDIDEVFTRLSALEENTDEDNYELEPGTIR